MRTLRIATRKSPLALWQAEYVRAQLLKANRDLEVELVEIVTEGDKKLDAPLADSGGKGLFMKELEHAMLRGEADVAVHSMKDVPAVLPEGFHIQAVCQRDDARDVFVSNRAARLKELPAGAVIGTCSLRRQCQLREKFPDIQTENLRGNVHTRLKKLDAGEFDGIILAAAGLRRLELEHRITEYFAPEFCLPAVGQGAVGIECRADDDATGALITALNHTDTALCVTAERAVNARLGGGCHLPLAAFAELRGGELNVRGMVGKVDGSIIYTAEATSDTRDTIALGIAVADNLLAQGAGKILEEYVG